MGVVAYLPSRSTISLACLFAIILWIAGAFQAFVLWNAAGAALEVQQRETANDILRDVQISVGQIEFMLDAMEAQFHVRTDLTYPEYSSFWSLMNITRVTAAVEYVPIVPHAERAAFVEKHRQTWPNFDITTRNLKGQLVHRRDAPEYFPVTYVEPLAPNIGALGYDLGSSETRLAALRFARSRNVAVASRRITLVQDRTAASILVRPIDINGTTIGFAALVIRLRSLLDHIHSTDVGVVFVDQSVGLEKAELLTHARVELCSVTLEEIEDGTAPSDWSDQLPFGSRSWVVYVCHPKASVAKVPIIILLISIVAGALVAASIFAHSARRQYDSLVHAPAPGTPMAIVFTDVEGSSTLWCRLGPTMKTSVMLHHMEVRRCIKKWHGYEVKTLGDAFMAAFERADNALSFGVELQESLPKVNWSAHLRTVCTKGLRVRVGIHWGVAMEVDPRTRRHDYYGTTVNTAARVASAAPGGTTLATYDVLDRVPAEVLARLNIAASPLGVTFLKGISERVSLFKVRRCSSLGGPCLEDADPSSSLRVSVIPCASSPSPSSPREALFPDDSGAEAAEPKLDVLVIPYSGEHLCLSCVTPSIIDVVSSKRAYLDLMLFLVRNRCLSSATFFRALLQALYDDHQLHAVDKSISGLLQLLGLVVGTGTGEAAHQRTLR